MALLGSSTKVEKGEKQGWLTAVMYLSPSNESGHNVCPHATPGCIAACLGHSSGRLAMPAHKQTRLRKTLWFFQDRAGFLKALREDIRRHKRKADKLGMKCAVRLNGSSDIAWEKVDPGLFTENPDVQFYDYTKSLTRALDWADGKLPPNYHITFSRAETEDNQAAARAVADAGGNVAVVFNANKENLPTEYYGVSAINGDETDLRFLDPKGCVVALTAKGAAKKDTTGFVVQLTKIER